MSSIVVIVIVAIVVLAIVVSVVTSPTRHAAKANSEFDAVFRAAFGQAPPQNASRAISTASGIIVAFTQPNADKRLGRDRLSSTLDEYSQAVGFDDEKVAFGLLFLARKSCNDDMTPMRGYEWAVQILIETMPA